MTAAVIVGVAGLLLFAGSLPAATVCPEDYGGTDTDKWQQLSWTVNANPGTHYDMVCHNDYTITEPIVFDNGGALDLTLLGHNAVITLPTGASLSFGRTSAASVVNMKYVTFQHIGVWDTDPLVYMAWINNSTFEKVHFLGDNACNRYYGLYIGQGNGLVFRTANFCNMEVGMQVGSPTSGISDNNQFYACSWHNNKLQGAFLSSVRSSSIIGCSSEWNKGVGIGIHSSSIDTYSEDVSIQSCYIFNNCIDTPTRYAIEIGVPQFYQGDWNVWYPQSDINLYNNMIDGTYQKGGIAIDGRDTFSMINNSVVKNPNESYHLEAWGAYSVFEVPNNRDTMTGQFYYLLTANTYTVTFDAQGGTAASPATKNVTYGAAYGTLVTTSRTGYTFGGWWTGMGGAGTEVTAATTVTVPAAHTVYAKWTASFSAAPSTVVLATASDTGVSATDGLTRLNNHAPAAGLSFVVSGTVAGAEVRLYADGTLIGSAVAGGTATVVQTDGVTTLTDGARSITATQKETGKFESATSPALTVTIDTVAPALLTALSRKTHGAAGTFDVTLPITSPWSIECRMANSSAVSLVFGFSEGVRMGAGGGVVVTAGTATPGTPVVTGKSLNVSLTGVADVQWLKLRLNPIADLAGNALDLSYTIGILAGDSTLNGSVNAQDILFVRYNSGQPLDQGNNFRYDLNASGAINAQDVLFVRSYSGNTLPPP